MKRYWTFALTAYLIYISSFLLSCGVLYPLHSFTRQVLDSLGRWRIDHDRSNWIQTDGPFEDIRRIVQRQTGLAIWMQKCGLTMRARIQSHNEHLKKAVLHAWASDWIVLCQIHLRYKDKCSQANIDTRTHFMLAVGIAFSRKYNLFFFKRGGIVDSSHADWFRFG